MQRTGELQRLAAMPPGPELAAALAGLQLPEIPNSGIVEVLRAQHRQLSHAHARLLATVLELSRTTPYSPNPADDAAGDGAGPGDGLGPAQRAYYSFEWAEGEIAAALRWTPGKAGWELRHAQVLIEELPAVFAALEAGLIDRRKAEVFVEYLDPAYDRLTRVQIDQLCASYVPLAARWTHRQLAARLLRAIIAIDPGAARDRYRRAVRARGVSCYLDPNDGTAVITADGLPVEEANAACARLDALAGAVKRAGHPARLPQITADLYLRMLDGSYCGLSEQQIITDMLSRRRPEDTPDHPETGSKAAAPDRGTDAEAAPGVEPAPGAGGEPSGIAVEPVDGPVPVRPRAGIEIRVGLATLLGRDQRPGEIPGLGPVPAEAARAAVAAQHRGASWRFAVVDDDGYLLLAGVTRRRPGRASGAPPDPDQGRCVGGIVELHLSAAQLAALAADATACGPWAGVVADVAGQFAQRERLLAGLDAHPHTRLARGPLARHIQVRDRSCCHPGCTRPAADSELDHTHDHAAGGPTVAANIDPSCRRHHWYKSELGWRLDQPEPGLFRWRSPLGQTYPTRGEQIMPELPEPVPRSHDEPDNPNDAGLSDGAILTEPLGRPEPARPPPLPLAVEDDPPPF